MNKLLKSLLVTGFSLSISIATVLAQPPPPTIITLNENGFGTYFPPGAPGPIAVPGVLMAADPSGGVAGPVLVYTMPGPALAIGDLLLFETTNTVSDVVRFWEFNQIIFYSDREPGAPDGDLADSGLPGFLLANVVSRPESGPEGNNGGVLVAFSGDPGWDGNPSGTTYQIMSDVPEPGSLALIGLSSGLALALRLRRKA